MFGNRMVPVTRRSLYKNSLSSFRSLTCPFPFLVTTSLLQPWWKGKRWSGSISRTASSPGGRSTMKLAPNKKQKTCDLLIIQIPSGKQWTNICCSEYSNTYTTEHQIFIILVTICVRFSNGWTKTYSEGRARGRPTRVQNK
jgi:hypothetical protein